MKQLTEIKVSWYENKFSKNPVEMSVYEVLKQIAKGKYASQVNMIRRYWEEGDKEAAQQLKGKLPAVTMSGTFSGGHSINNLLTHSSLILIDFDHPEDPVKLARVCRQDPHTAFSFGSPTDGYKVGVYVEGAEKDHRRAWQLVSDYYQQLTGLKCDESCKDPSRLCYMSFDEDIYIPPFYESFSLDHTPEETINDGQKEKGESEFVALPVTGEETMEEAVEEFIKSWIFLKPYTKGERNATVYKMACEACKRGYTESAILREIVNKMEELDFPASEIRRTVSSGYKRVINENRRKEGDSYGGSETAKVQKCRYRDDETGLSEEELYWKGEELRRNTPLIPEEVYKNIPTMLKDCLPHSITLRERDLLLLSLLTAYSSILPNTTGTYNHKRFSPHLFTFGIAPAGSGKSIVQLARKLLKIIEEQIYQASEMEYQKYEQLKMEWQEECVRKVRKKEKINHRDAPEEPPFKILVIPGAASGSRMQIHIKDNGSMGGIIFDTEAQTMANANQMDCGHFDDMLCKAFEHETISSSYKVNGKRPIIIPYPRLALFVTETSEQFYMLIKNPENGLFSRILIYTFREDLIWKIMDEEEENWEDMYEVLAHNAAQLYQFCQSHPMTFNFTRDQWRRLNKVFSGLLSEVAIEGNDHLQAVVKRHGFMVMRIAMILTRLRQYEEKDVSVSFRCSDTDFETAMEIVKCCYQHSRLILTSMPSGQSHALKDPDRRKRFMDELPDEFTTQEAVQAGARYGISERTVKEILSNLKGKKINKIVHGKYEKIK